MPLDNFKEIVDKKGYRVERDDREIFEKGITKSNIGRGFSDYIEFILYDSNDNQLPQGEGGIMARYIPLTDENISRYFLLGKDELKKKSNKATQYILDTEQLIKEAGYENGVFKTHTAIVNRRVGSERPMSEKAELNFEDSLWIQEISPSRTEVRVLPMRDGNDDILDDLELRYNIFLNESHFYDDTIYYINEFVQSLDLDTIVGSFLTLRGSVEKGQQYRDLIRKEFKINNWESFLSDIRNQWIESVRFFVQNREWRLSRANYGDALSTIPSPDLGIPKIRQIVQEALIEAIEKYLPVRDIQEETILTPEEQESYDKIRQILKRLTGNNNYTSNNLDNLDDSTDDDTDSDDDDEPTNPPVVATDDDGEPITYKPKTPDIVFSYFTDGLSVTVEDETVMNGTNLIERKWDFGDGTIEKQFKKATHRYTTTGQQNITLRITYRNNVGLVDVISTTQSINVSAIKQTYTCQEKIRDGINPNGTRGDIIKCDGLSYIWSGDVIGWEPITDNRFDREDFNDSNNSNDEDRSGLEIN